jgi:alpha-tubulin suppressor-like RCC1 family protein
MTRAPNPERSLDPARREPRLATLGAMALLCACAVDARNFDELAPANTGAGGDTGSVVGSSGGAGESANQVGLNPAGLGGSPAELGPNVTLLVNGSSCGAGAPCESSRCEVSTVEGQSVCCALDCADSERCSADGASCLPLPGVAGQACSDALPCAPGLACTPGGANQLVCCAQACPEGQFCVDQGGRCEAPQRADGAECVQSGQCISGYCDLDRRLCAINPCVGKPVGSYCARGAQCDAAELCTFTGMGIVAAGDAHTCAIFTDGNVRCWGNNEGGTLGIPPEQVDIFGDTLDEIPRNAPVLSFGGRRAIQVSAGGWHSCALLEDGNVRCWGQTSLNQLTPARADGDVFLPSGERAVSIDAGGAHTCAVLASRQLTCWGDNIAGHLGLGHNQLIANVELAPLPLAEPVTLVTAGNLQTCAVLASGALQCWGEGQGGLLGYGEASDRFTPLGNVDVGAPVLFASTSTDATCVVIEGGFVRCWGRNDQGVLGYGHAEDIGVLQTPAQAATSTTATGLPLGGNVALGGGGVVQVEADSGTGHVCARFSGGAVRCWGDNNNGSLGYGHIEAIGDDETPAQAAVLRPGQLGGDVPFGRSVLALASGGHCAVLNDRSVICWGRNTGGQLGLPVRFPNGTPEETPADLLATRVGPLAID